MSHDGPSAIGKPADDLTRELVAGQIGELVRELLGRDIDRDENYFEAGLNSLTVVKLHTIMSTRLGVRVPVIALFQHPNVRETAALVVKSKGLDRQRPVDRTAKAPDPRAAGSRREIRVRIRRAEETW